MASKSERLWYILGASVLALVGLIDSDNPLYYFGLMGVGWISLAIAVQIGGLSRPRTAFSFLIVSNLAFWLSYGVWTLRIRLSATPPDGGFDSFAIAVSIWLLAITVCMLYETLIFVRGLFAASQRRMSLVGLGAVAVQLLTTARVIYSMIQGV